MLERIVRALEENAHHPILSNEENTESLWKLTKWSAKLGFAAGFALSMSYVYELISKGNFSGANKYVMGFTEVGSSIFFSAGVGLLNGMSTYFLGWVGGAIHAGFVEPAIVQNNQNPVPVRAPEEAKYAPQRLFPPTSNNNNTPTISVITHSPPATSPGR